MRRVGGARRGKETWKNAEKSVREGRGTIRLCCRGGASVRRFARGGGRQASGPDRPSALHSDGGISEDRSGTQADRTFQDTRIFGDCVVAVVGRMRMPRPRIRRLQGLRKISRQDGDEARAVLQRLGEDREGKGEVRLRVARCSDSACRVGRRQAVDLPLLRQSGLQVRPRHRNGRCGRGRESGGFRGVAEVLRRSRQALRRRRGRVGGLERAVRQADGGLLRPRRSMPSSRARR